MGTCLGDFGPRCRSASLHQNAARWYDSATGRFTSEDPIGEGGFCYALAAHKLRGEYSVEDVQVGGEYFLKRNVPEFIQYDYERLARWLKILHWNDEPTRLSAFETVRKCFDYLPGVERPA